MVNQSLISLPPNLGDEVVLRRTLSAIIEVLDIAVGNKQGKNSLFTEQQKLLDQTLSITKQLDAASKVLEEVVVNSSDSSVSDKATESIENILSNAFYSSFGAEFVGRTDNGPVTLNKSRNASNAERVSQGVYTFASSTALSSSSYFVSNDTVKVDIISSNSIQISVYRNGALFDPIFNVAVVGLYVPN